MCNEIAFMHPASSGVLHAKLQDWRCVPNVRSVSWSSNWVCQDPEQRHQSAIVLKQSTATGTARDRQCGICVVGGGGHR